jgi:hypothetical protein
VRTYDEAAQWLPTDVREAIEDGMPCPRHSKRHSWRHESATLSIWGRGAVRVIEHWQCDCGLIRATNPGVTE